MSKELEALKALGSFRVDSTYFVDLRIRDTYEYDIIETALKALEIIKKSGCLYLDSNSKMLKTIGGIDLTPELYDLLNSVL